METKNCSHSNLISILANQMYALLQCENNSSAELCAPISALLVYNALKSSLPRTLMYPSPNAYP